MRKGGFVWRDHRTPDQPSSTDDVRRHHNDARRKRVRRLSDGDRIEPHDVLVSIRKLGAIVVEVSGLRGFVVMRREVAMDQGGVTVRVRLVHMFPRQRS
jgi:hypothetical protein